MLVVDEKTEKFKSEKRGDVESRRLVCLDADPNPGETMKATFDYELRENETQFFGKLRMKQLVLWVEEWTLGFGGRFRVRGGIVPESLKTAGVIPSGIPSRPEASK